MPAAGQCRVTSRPPTVVCVPARGSGGKLDEFIVSRKARSLAYRIRSRFARRRNGGIDRQVRGLIGDGGNLQVVHTSLVHHPRLLPDNLIRLPCPVNVVFHGLDLIDLRRMGVDVRRLCRGVRRVLYNSEATREIGHSCGPQRDPRWCLVSGHLSAPVARQGRSAGTAGTIGHSR